MIEHFDRTGLGLLKNRNTKFLRRSAGKQGGVSPFYLALCRDDFAGFRVNG
jgi:hypothetical protein